MGRNGDWGYMVFQQRERRIGAGAAKRGWLRVLGLVFACLLGPASAATFTVSNTGNGTDLNHNGCE